MNLASWVPGSEGAGTGKGVRALRFWFCDHKRQRGSEKKGVGPSLISLLCDLGKEFPFVNIVSLIQLLFYLKSRLLNLRSEGRLFAFHSHCPLLDFLGGLCPLSLDPTGLLPSFLVLLVVGNSPTPSSSWKRFQCVTYSLKEW